MFKKLSTLVAVASIVAAPAAMGHLPVSEASVNMSRGSLKAAGQLTTNIFQASGKVSTATVDLTVGFSKAVYGAAKKGINYSGRAGKAGIDFSVEAVDGTVAVLSTTAKWSGERLVDAKDMSVQVVTKSGEIVVGGYNMSKKAVSATLHFSGHVVDETGKVIGKMAKAAEKGAKWTANMSGRAIQVSITTSGKVLNASGEVIGDVVDAAGNGVRFIVTSTGDMLQFSVEKAVVTFNASKGAMKELYKGAKYVGGKAMNASGMVVKAVVNAAGDVLFTSAKTAGLSLQYTFEGQPSKAIKVVAWLPANTMKALIYSDMHYKGLK